MAATTTDRNTLKYYIQREILLTLKTATSIPAGVMVAVDANGVAVNASDTAALVVMGVSAHAASNVAPATDTVITVERGIFILANDGTVPATQVGKLVTVLDNQTVSIAATTTNDIPAGYCEEVRSDGVAVAMLGGLIGAA